MARRHTLSRTQALGLTAEILLTYVRVRRLGRGRDLDQVMARVRAGPRRAHSGPALDRAAALHLGDAVTRVLRTLPADDRCLVRALVLSSLLTRRGLPIALVIGVRTSPRFAAHAWVEHAGRPLLATGGYERLTEL